MKIFNTLSGKMEEFKTMKDGAINMYVCGPTVYSYAHVGNMCPVIIFDMVYRYLKYAGYKVTYASNFTDVDDKIINRANILGKDPLDFSKEQIREAEIDMKELHVKDADVKPKASENIDNIIKFVQGLIKKGYAYESSNGDVYYIVRKFNEYGKKYNEIMAKDISDEQKQILADSLLNETKSFDEKNRTAIARLNLEYEKLLEDFKGKVQDSKTIYNQMQNLHLFDKNRYFEDIMADANPDLRDLYKKRYLLNSYRVLHNEFVYSGKTNPVLTIINDVLAKLRHGKTPLMLRPTF